MGDHSLAEVPEALVGVIVEAARGVLRGRTADALTPALRPLARFDQRAAASATVRRQFLTALARDDDLRREVAVAVTSRDDVARLLADFARSAAAVCAARAADSGELAVLAAALWAAAPDGWELGLGAVAAVEHERRAVAALVEEHDDLHARVASLEHDVAQQRAAHATHGEETAELNAKLTSERAARRAAEQRAADAVAAIDQLRAELDGARAAAGEHGVALAMLRDELARERQRRRELDADRAGTNAAPAIVAPGPSVTPDELAQLADAAADLTRRLRAAATREETAPVPAASPVAPRPRPTAPTGRTKPSLPRGLVADTVDGARAMLSEGGATLVVDGYNVSNHAWPGATPALQRDRLERGLQQVRQRFGCDVVCCYDGDDSVGVAGRRIAGVRVRFSASHEEADELVVDTVQGLPKRVPAVVASSDAWVREHAEGLGAIVVSAATMAALITAAGRR